MSYEEMEQKENNRSMITKELVDKICQEISRGVPIKYACAIAGIKHSTFYDWVKKGRELPHDSKSLYKYAELKKEEAKAYSIASRVEKIRLDPSWQSAAWYLERVAHEEFGKKQTIDANVNAKVKSEDISKLFNDAKVSKILDEENK